MYFKKSPYNHVTETSTRNNKKINLGEKNTKDTSSTNITYRDLEYQPQ